MPKTISGKPRARFADTPKIMIMVNKSADALHKAFKVASQFFCTSLRQSSGSWGMNLRMHCTVFSCLHFSLCFLVETMIDRVCNILFPQKRKAVALNHYETTPNSCTDSSDGNKDCDTIHSLATEATAIARNVESHENAGFQYSQDHDKNAEKRGVDRDISNPGDTNPDQTNSKGKNRKVRFDLRDAKGKNERRAFMRNIPDIIVISEEAGMDVEFDDDERKRACDEDACDDDDENDDMPTDLSSIFEDSRESYASVSTISDDEGAVVTI